MRGKRRFEDREVVDIRTAYDRGAGLKTLAFYWTVNRKVIQDIVHGRTYKNVGGPLSKPQRICPECRQIIQGKAA